jgi:hypothetical protein
MSYTKGHNTQRHMKQRDISLSETIWLGRVVEVECAIGG